MPIRMPMNISSFSEDFSAGFSPLISLVYISICTKTMSGEELEELAATARANNSTLGLTGMLLYYEGVFMQALEGPEQAVHQMYARIGRDPRHTDLVTLVEEYIPERNFPEWVMGFYWLKPEAAQQLEGFSPFAGAQQFFAYFQATPQASLTLLQSIRNAARD